MPIYPKERFINYIIFLYFLSNNGLNLSGPGGRKMHANPKTFLRIGSYYKTTIDNLKIMNHLKLLTKYN